VKQAFRLTRSADFERVRQSGKSYPHPLIVLLALPNAMETVRIGVAAGKSVGNAVIRNRAKRVLRACLTNLLPEVQTGWDIIVLARKPLPGAGYSQTLTALQVVMKRAGLLNARRGTDER
jgi:ribonuclease P protein component